MDVFMGRYATVEQSISSYPKSLMQQQTITTRPPLHPNSILICPICQHYLTITLQTPCSHTFCAQCIQHYLLYLQECPTCQQQLHPHGLIPNYTIDSLVQQIIAKHIPNPIDKQQWHHDKAEARSRLRQKGGLEWRDVHYRMHVDIWDNQEAVWCGGIVMDVYCLLKKVRVKYMGRSKAQILSVTSNRLVKYGTYSKSWDAPFLHGGRKMMEDLEEEGQYRVIVDQDPDCDELNQQ